MNNNPSGEPEPALEADVTSVKAHNGPWAIHGLGAPGVTLSQNDMVALAESILARVR